MKSSNENELFHFYSMFDPVIQIRNSLGLLVNDADFHQFSFNDFHGTEGSIDFGSKKLNRENRIFFWSLDRPILSHFRQNSSCDHCFGRKRYGDPFKEGLIQHFPYVFEHVGYTATEILGRPFSTVRFRQVLLVDFQKETKLCDSDEISQGPRLEQPMSFGVCFFADLVVSALCRFFGRHHNSNGRCSCPDGQHARQKRLIIVQKVAKTARIFARKSRNKAADTSRVVSGAKEIAGWLKGDKNNKGDSGKQDRRSDRNQPLALVILLHHGAPLGFTFDCAPCVGGKAA